MANATHVTKSLAALVLSQLKQQQQQAKQQYDATKSGIGYFL